MNERKFGEQIKQKLDQTLDLDPATRQRLKSAREQALARQRMAEPAFVPVWADAPFGSLTENPAPAGVRLAGAVLVLALVGMQYWQRSPSAEELEEIDAALLTSDLPINAYLDKRFDTWLKRSQH